MVASGPGASAASPYNPLWWPRKGESDNATTPSLPKAGQQLQVADLRPSIIHGDTRPAPLPALPSCFPHLSTSMGEGSGPHGSTPDKLKASLGVDRIRIQQQSHKQTKQTDPRQFLSSPGFLIWRVGRTADSLRG